MLYGSCAYIQYLVNLCIISVCGVFPGCYPHRSELYITTTGNLCQTFFSICSKFSLFLFVPHPPAASVPYCKYKSRHQYHKGYQEPSLYINPQHYHNNDGKSTFFSFLMLLYVACHIRSRLPGINSAKMMIPRENATINTAYPYSI